MKTGSAENVLVLWYSQTGYTERCGRLLAKTFENSGLMVASSELRDYDKKGDLDYDLIVIGSPVYYTSKTFLCIFSSIISFSVEHSASVVHLLKAMVQPCVS